MLLIPRLLIVLRPHPTLWFLPCSLSMTLPCSSLPLIHQRFITLIVSRHPSFLHHAMWTRQPEDENPECRWIDCSPGRLRCRMNEWTRKWKTWIALRFHPPHVHHRCPHIVAGQLRTCLNYTRRTSQSLLSLKGINVSSTRLEQEQRRRGRGKRWGFFFLQMKQEIQDICTQIWTVISCDGCSNEINSF